MLRRQIGRNYMISLILIQHLHFSNYMTNTFQKCFPKETIKINNKNKNPWINQTLRKEIKERDKLYWISRKHPSTENKEIYKKFKNTNLNNQRKAERSYYREQFELNKQDLKKSWKIIKNIIGKDDKKYSMKQIDF